MDSINFPVEIKTEPIDVCIKSEPIDYDIPEMVCIKSESHEQPSEETQEEEEEGLIEDALEPQRYIINFGDPQVPHNIPNTDLSIFWKPFQEQQLTNPKGKVYLTNREFGKYFLSTICQGHVLLNLTRGWNIYYVKEAVEVKLLLSEMNVENGIPVMRRQIIINTFLQVSLFYGSREIRNIDLVQTKIKSAKCIKQLVGRFSQWKMCVGLAKDFDRVPWVTSIQYDALSKSHRHKSCQLLHQSAFEQCLHCKYLQVRAKKVEQVRARNYMTSSMMVNFKYWKKMWLRMKHLKKCNRTLRRDKINLKRKLRQLQRKKTNDNVNAPNESVVVVRTDNISCKSIDLLIKQENGLDLDDGVFVKDET